MTLQTLPSSSESREHLLARANDLSKDLRTTLEDLFGSSHALSDRLVTIMVALHHELAALEARPTDAGFLAEPAPHDDAPAADSAAVLQRFAMDAQARCVGWHPAEVDGAGSAFRWSGPGVESFITVQIDRASAGLLSIYLIGVLEDDKLTGLRITVDGVAKPFDLVKTESGSALHVALAANALPTTMPTEIGLRVPRCASPASLGRGDDERKLGLAVSEITFLPA
jgi:cell division protein ZapA (FtsZ GTPase activity inhibitor)